MLYAEKEQDLVARVFAKKKWSYGASSLIFPISNYEKASSQVSDAMRCDAMRENIP